MTKKIQSLQGIRAVAFIGILLQHASVICMGSFGVSVFFILSGFVAYICSKDLSLKEAISPVESVKFAIKRIKKIYPTHIMTMLGVAVLFSYEALLVDKSKDNFIGILRSMLYHVTLTNDWSVAQKNSLNGVSWFLSAILFIYIFAPFMIWGAKHIKSFSVSIVCFVITLSAQTIFAYLVADLSNAPYLLYNFPIFRMFDFFIGILVGVCYQKTTWKCSFGTSTIVELLAIALCVISNIFYITDSIPLTMLKEDIWFIIPNSFAIFCFAFGKGFFSKILSSRILVKIGDYSGHMFLISQCVFYYINVIVFKIIGENDLNIMKATLVFVLTYCFTVLWTKVCGKLFNRGNRI